VSWAFERRLGQAQLHAEAGASLSADHYESEIKPLIDLLEVAMHEYIIASRRFAVRLALQDGLKEYAATNRHRPTTDRIPPVSRRCQRGVNPAAQTPRRARPQLSSRTLVGADLSRVRDVRKCVAA
jgi:hypothetical protein